VSLTPLKSWRWQSKKNYRIFLLNFSSVNDAAEINVIPLKSQTDFTTPFSSFKGKIQQKIFKWQISPYYCIQVLEAVKSGGF
jgi:hypothetical protein